MLENAYSKGIEETYSLLGASEQGLSSKEARSRLKEYGFNEIKAKDVKTGKQILFSQFKSPLIIILIIASIIAGFLGEPIEAVIILVIVFVNAGLAFYQEFKSERAVAELRKYISFKAKVLRDNQKTEVKARDLVPGDIVFLSIGDIVPADLRIIESQELSINESALTGESFPAAKSPAKIELPNATISQQSNIAFMGTIVENGGCKGIVVSTGVNNVFGKTATVLSAKEPPTDFQKNIKNFGQFLLKIIFVLTVFVFLANAFLGKGILDSFLFALALAVGITPELLPIIITITLSTAAIGLAKKKIVVKRLIAIEDLGNVNVLCVDKTGTLTENKIVLEKFVDCNGGKSEEILELGLLCNSATIENEKAKGNFIDTAIWERATKQQKNRLSDYALIEEVGFDHKRRRMSVIVEKSGKRFLICKGAPESLVGACSHVQGKAINGKQIAILEKFLELSSQGFRAVGIARKEIAKKDDYALDDEKDLDFAGFLFFSDPPRRTATTAVKQLQELGVELKILTGDNELVTRHVCESVGFEIRGMILGSELALKTGADFEKAISENNVFARITPEQKYAIVTGLSKQGNIVGFLGDGVNDAPALKASDVGITVDLAVDVAKDSADIILLHKSLLVLADGIKAGRKTFGNITKYIYNTISANFGNMFTLAISSIFLKFIPLLPAQILLANLISDGPLMTVSVDNVDEEYVRKPKRWNIRAISRFMVFFGLISMAFDFLTIGLLLFVLNAEINVFRTAWLLETILSEILVTFVIRTRKSFWKSKPSKALIYASLTA
ncbi:MAG: magnesium-translocating P-type ATPase, partial [Candidatus Diapherotrites archaeon]|nr:magnesium-translocating P-type ATPase [Candidatus Diapherotrites archaeon]